MARVAIGLFAAAGDLFAADSAQQAEQFCVSCHGPEFNGGRAPAIGGGTWRQARNDDDAVRIIMEGLPAAGMPAFGKTFAAAGCATLVEFIKSRTSPKKVSGSYDRRDGKTAIYRTRQQNFRIEQVAEGYEVPWSLAFLSDGRLLVTERPGRLRIVEHGNNSPPIQGIPRVWSRQDAGLLSLELDPDYDKNGWIYLSYSEPGTERRTSMTKIVRGRIKDGAWIDQQVIWQAQPRYYRQGDDHYGCRLLFVRGQLFFTIGDRGDRRNAQDISNPCGKVHRIEADGSIPSDNPFLDTPGAYPSVWSFGHRNPQGLSFNERTGELWATEHGPMGGDEINRIQPGKNYGWPVVTFGRDHDGSIISEFTSKPGMIDPVAQWTPSIAVSPVHISLSDRYPAWKDDLLIGSLAREEFRRLEVKDDKVAQQELLFKGLGRIRDIKTGPDGYIYLVIEHRHASGEVIRLVPVLE